MTYRYASYRARKAEQKRIERAVIEEALRRYATDPTLPQERILLVNKMLGELYKQDHRGGDR